MEENLKMEQPTINTDNTAYVGAQNTQKSERESICSEEIGSTSFGKFKDATTLYEAYNNLQKEFTKKSQQLSAILKDSKQNEYNDKIADSVKNNTVFDKNNSENADFFTNNLNEDKKYAFQKSDWTSKAMTFFNNNQDAKQYSKDIAKLLMEDKSLATSPNCLDYAYAIIKNKSYKEPASYLTDQKFLEDNIYNNNQIKDKIINDYLSSIINKKNSVKVITGQAGNVSLTPPADKPKSLKEASLILTKLLQK